MTVKQGQFEPGDLLLVIDVQKDFCPGGALAIEGGDAVVPVLNEWIGTAQDAEVPLYFSRDWHPKNHLSFVDYGGPWPPHCIQDSDGAGFHPGLAVPADAVIVTKGTRFDQDQNSAFDQTGLADWLHGQRIRRIFVGGLALDVCVLATVLDGCKANFEMCLISKAARPVFQEHGRKAIETMQQAGARILLP